MRDLHHSQGTTVAEVIGDGGDDFPGQGDSYSVWMALTTERERLRLIVETKQNGIKRLNDDDVEETRKVLTRVSELVELSWKLRKEIGAVFANDTEKGESK